MSNLLLKIGAYIWAFGLLFAFGGGIIAMVSENAIVGTVVFVVVVISASAFMLLTIIGGCLDRRDK